MPKGRPRGVGAAPDEARPRGVGAAPDEARPRGVGAALLAVALAVMAAGPVWADASAPGVLGDDGGRDAGGEPGLPADAGVEASVDAILEKDPVPARPAIDWDEGQRQAGGEPSRSRKRDRPRVAAPAVPVPAPAARRSPSVLSRVEETVNGAASAGRDVEAGGGEAGGGEAGGGEAGGGEAGGGSARSAGTGEAGPTSLLPGDSGSSRQQPARDGASPDGAGTALSSGVPRSESDNGGAGGAEPGSGAASGVGAGGAGADRRDEPPVVPPEPGWFAPRPPRLPASGIAGRVLALLGERRAAAERAGAGGSSPTDRGGEDAVGATGTGGGDAVDAAVSPIRVRVRFARSSAGLSMPARKRIETFAELVFTRGSGAVRVLLPKPPARLSRARASATRRYLRRLGVPGSAMTVKPHRRVRLAEVVLATDRERE